MKKTKRTPTAEGYTITCPVCHAGFGTERSGQLHVNATVPDAAGTITVEMIAGQLFTFTCGGCRNRLQWCPAGQSDTK